MAEKLDFKKIEKKWQKRWEERGIFKTKKNDKKKFYVLEMFPYPSGSGLHMGHAFNYTIGDIYARFKRMCGFNVLYPMGYDALGLPAENAAIKAGENPEKYTENAIKNFMEQQKSIGLSYDWSRMVRTCDSEYYKWNQYFFLKFLENGLAYRKKSPVNWCPECKTVLANEQVHNGKCWRHKNTEVEIRHLEQWFIKTTKYAEELLEGIEGLDWPDRIKSMQKHWIGKSHGTEIIFEINGKKWPIFTTRPDTIFGVTFMVISAQHPKLMELVTEDQEKNVKKFLKKIKSTSEKDQEELEKEGAFTGSYAVNPVNGEKVPVYTGNFVVAEYGSGMVMAVPSHDQRDFEFAKKYNIPIKVVISPKDHDIEANEMERAYTERGVLVNSDDFNGIDNEEAIIKITDFLEKKGIGKRTVQYKLRDWLISRQRYWGTPIPTIYCDKCGILPVPEEELPIKLPKDVKFGEGNPLKTSDTFVNIKCPKCGGSAKRETDTMDTFFDSSWYFLRYSDNKNTKKPFDKDKADYWMPVDKYIGGAEHACMHLIYARFFTKALRDMGFLNIDEPFESLFNQGMLHGEDEHVMSKSRGNVVLPETVSKRFGIDTARLFLVSVASPDKDIKWSEKGIEGSMRLIKRICSYFDDIKFGKDEKRIESKLQRAIKEVTENIEAFKYNMAVIGLRDIFKEIEGNEISKKTAETFLKLLHPFCPHITEELWEKIGNKELISGGNWPEIDNSKIDPEAEMSEKLIETVKNDIEEIKSITKIENPKKIRLFVSKPWKYEVYLGVKDGKEIGDFMKNNEYKKTGKELVNYVQRLMKKRPTENILKHEKEIKTLENEKKNMEKELGAEIEIIKSEESQENKAKQSEPMKPGILLE